MDNGTESAMSAFAFYSQQSSDSKPEQKNNSSLKRKRAKKFKANTKAEIKTTKKVKPKLNGVKKQKYAGIKAEILPKKKDTVEPKHKVKKHNVEQVVSDKTNDKTTTKNKKICINNPDSLENGRQVFSWLISPVDTTKFFRDNWEKQPIYISRNCASYFSYLVSCEEIDQAIRTRKMFFTKNIDITSYANGVRETHNPAGRATAPLVWDYYANDCSVRILNPQKYFSKIHALNATLQEFFGCLVGANIYLTPAGTQGFAPHYDDIEAFVMQIEGEKRWKLYAPRNAAETLPRYSSGNFKPDELGEPIQEILMKPGDLLYFPRGIVHEAQASAHTHSLHITLSMYQRNSWADLLEKLLPAALKHAAEEDVSFREGLPLHYLSHMGLVHSDKISEARVQFFGKLENLMKRLVQYAPVDAAVDQMGKQFIHDSLPPYLRKEETAKMIVDGGEKIKAGNVYNQAEIDLDTRVKLVRYNCIRVVNEDEGIVRIYYSVNNSREYHADEPQYLELDCDLAPAVEALITSYPAYLEVEEFPIPDDAAKVQVAGDLWERGLLMTEEPLGYTSD